MSLPFQQEIPDTTQAYNKFKTDFFVSNTTTGKLIVDGLLVIWHPACPSASVWP
jgi:hypothetical protein